MAIARNILKQVLTTIMVSILFALEALAQETLIIKTEDIPDVFSTLDSGEYKIVMNVDFSKLSDYTKRMIGFKNDVKITFLDMSEVTGLDSMFSYPGYPDTLCVPKTVKYVGSFYRHTKLIIPSENEHYCTLNNKYLLSKDGKTLYGVFGEYDSILVIPNGVETIKDIDVGYSYGHSYGEKGIVLHKFRKN